MSLGQFDLRGWKSSGDSDTESFTNVLGIKWDSKKDVIFVNTEFVSNFDLSCITRRTILSVAHRIFDPIGFVCPALLCPKILLQKTWDDKGGSWDTEVDEEISNEFRVWFKELQSLEKVKIPRWIGKSIANNNGCSLHTFCDGSSQAYATVIFLKTETEDEASVQLVAAKSRVRPTSTKQTTIPRLELLAALVGVRLTNSIINAMEWSEIPVYYWTDSSTVLAWIKQDKKWTVFVQNRVSEIRRTTNPVQWNHIPGKENPADLPSRGCNASQLAESKWWEGPEWMKYPIEMWPMNMLQSNKEEINEEVRKTKLKVTTSQMTNISESKRLKYLQKLRQDLRQRFRKEYLGQLVHRLKNKKYRNLEIGEIVLLECDNIKRVDCPLAIVVDVLPSEDGTVRLAKVKTQNGILLRPIQRLYPLEVTSKKDPIVIRRMQTRSLTRKTLFNS